MQDDLFDGKSDVWGRKEGYYRVVYPPLNAMTIILRDGFAFPSYRSEAFSHIFFLCRERTTLLYSLLLTTPLLIAKKPLSARG